MSGAISVIIADDHAIFREGLAQIITVQNDMRVVGEASDGDEVIALLRRTRCDVLVLDLSMPRNGGMSLIGRIHASFRGVPILVLSMHEQRPFVTEALRSGASGYVTKASPSAELLEGIRRVARGGTFVGTIASEQLAKHLRDAEDDEREPALSAREREILHLLVAGSRVSEIARTLNLSEKTVSTHKIRLQNKIGVASVAGLVRYAIAHGMVEGEAGEDG